MSFFVFVFVFDFGPFWVAFGVYLGLLWASKTATHDPPYGTLLGLKRGKWTHAGLRPPKTPQEAAKTPQEAAKTAQDAP